MEQKPRPGLWVSVSVGKLSHERNERFNSAGRFEPSPIHRPSRANCVCATILVSLLGSLHGKNAVPVPSSEPLGCAPHPGGSLRPRSSVAEQLPVEEKVASSNLVVVAALGNECVGSIPARAEALYECFVPAQSGLGDTDPTPDQRWLADEQLDGHQSGASVKTLTRKEKDASPEGQGLLYIFPLLTLQGSPRYVEKFSGNRSNRIRECPARR